MRSYPTDSPEAAARLLALVLVSDGHVCTSELQALARLGLERELGLAPGRFGPLMHTLCEDLLAGAASAGSALCQVDPATLDALLAEVQAPALRRTVLRLADAAAQADRHLAPAELQLLAAARRAWAADLGSQTTAAAAAATA